MSTFAGEVSVRGRAGVLFGLQFLQRKRVPDRQHLGSRPGVSNTRHCVSNTRSSVSNTQPGVSDTSLGMYNTHPGVYTTFPGVSNTLSGVSYIRSTTCSKKTSTRLVASMGQARCVQHSPLCF